MNRPSASGRARLIKIADITQPEEQAWRRLVKVAIEPNPFFEPDFVLPLARVRPKDNAHLLVVEHDGEWTACLPVVKKWRWRRIPAPILATWMNQYTFLGTPLLVADGVNPLLTMLTGAQKIRAGGLALEWISADCEVARLLRQALSRYSGHSLEWESFERAALKRRPGESVVEVSTKQRNEFRRKRKALERDCGEDLRLVDRAGDNEAVESFLELEVASWKGRESTAIASKDQDKDFFRQICKTFADKGQLQLLALQGSRIVAMQCNFIARNTIFGFRTCFDERFGRNSPGAQILLESLGAFNEGNAEWLDSCTSVDNTLCNRLMRDRKQVRSVFVAPPTLLGSLVYAWMTIAWSIKHGKARVRQSGALAGPLLAFVQRMRVPHIAWNRSEKR